MTKYYEIRSGIKTNFDALLLEIDSAIADLVELKVCQLAANLDPKISKELGSEFDIYRKIYRMQLLDLKHKELSRVKNGAWWSPSTVSKKTKKELLEDIKSEVESLKVELDALNERTILNENIKKIFKKYS